MSNLQNENTKFHTKNSKEFVVQKISKDNRKSLTARVKPEDLIVFNQRLKLFGFNSINELVHQFIAGRFPQITEDKQNIQFDRKYSVKWTKNSFRRRKLYRCPLKSAVSTIS